MEPLEIKVENFYTAIINGRLTIVQVDKIIGGSATKFGYARWCVTNLSTGRKATFRLAQKFRAKVNQKRGIEVLYGKVPVALVAEETECHTKI